MDEFMDDFIVILLNIVTIVLSSSIFAREDTVMDLFIVVLFSIVAIVMIVIEKRSHQKRVDRIRNINTESVTLEHVGFMEFKGDVDKNHPIFRIKGVPELIIYQSWRSYNKRTNKSSNFVKIITDADKEMNQTKVKDTLIHEISCELLTVNDQDQISYRPF